MTQFEFARAIDCHTSTVNRWVTGKNKPSKLWSKIIEELISK
jgi:DNA-binding transcriptional regulator YiaG